MCHSQSQQRVKQGKCNHKLYHSTIRFHYIIYHFCPKNFWTFGLLSFFSQLTLFPFSITQTLSKIFWEKRNPILLWSFFRISQPFLCSLWDKSIKIMIKWTCIEKRKLIMSKILTKWSVTRSTTKFHNPTNDETNIISLLGLVIEIVGSADIYIQLHIYIPWQFSRLGKCLAVSKLVKCLLGLEEMYWVTNGMLSQTFFGLF